MKKEYIMPEVLVETLALESVIALSVNDDEANPNGTVLGKDDAIDAEDMW